MRTLIKLGHAEQRHAIILILNGMLLALKDDMDVQLGAWESTPPLFATRSVGAILIAASNYFRHSDEWKKWPENIADQKTK